MSIEHICNECEREIKSDCVCEACFEKAKHEAYEEGLEEGDQKI